MTKIHKQLFASTRMTLCCLTLFLLTTASALSAERQFLHPGHVPAAVANLRPVDRLSGATRLDLAIGLPLRNREALTNLLQQIYDPASPRFHQYLTQEQFTELFGPAEQDYQRVIDYAQSHGLQVTGTHPNRVLLDVNGSVADIEKAFQVTMRVYPHPTEARTFFAPDVEPSVEPGIPILDISGLDNFILPHPADLRIAPADNPVITNAATGSGPNGLFIGNDFRAAYAPGVALTGVGQTIGLFEFGPYFTNDISIYETDAHLPAVAITNVLLDGYTGIPAAGADDGEEALDIQMAMCMAPGATILVYEGNSAADIYNRMATDNKAKQMSCSFGFSPPPATMDQIFQQYAAQGQAMFQASGDGGANAGAIFPPWDDPNITVVGGTSLNTSGPGGPWLSETTWRGSGGGVSTTYSIPSWQLGIDMTANQGSTTMRNIPDVSILADTIIFTVNKNGQTGGIGGTSAAAPMWAGFMALVNQQAAANGRPPVGFFNPTIYALGKGPNRASILHDITTGNNTNSSSPTKFFAVPGYDLCTGWGSPIGPNLINALAGPNDALQIQPGIGFTATVPYGLTPGPTALDLFLTNTGAASLDWALTNTAPWLDVSATNGTLTPGGAAAIVTLSLNTSAVGALSAGVYTANVLFSNLTSGVTQSRLFILNVSTADFPVAVTGFNAGVIVPNNATVASPQATGFDILNNISFYEAGLNANPQVSGSGGTQGLPQNGLITSQSDGATTFQLGPYGGANALMLGDTYPASGTLTLANPQAYNSLAVLAASANGGGLGTMVVHFTNGASSQTFNFNAQDWFNTTANVAIKGFGRLDLNSGLFTENNGANNPNLYQTKINLAALGLNQAVASVTFTKPNIGGSQDSGVFALSGSLMPPQVSITQQPRSATNNLPGTSTTFSVVAMGNPPLAYQWFSTNTSSRTGAELTGQTNASLVFNPALTSEAGSYFVVVSNAFNAVASSPATLIVYTTPVITQQPAPTNLVLYVGGSVSLSVTATAALPLYYTWYRNGTPIAGATAPQHALNNVQLADSGNYNVTLSNSFGAVTSSIVSLTVIASPNRSYPETVLADKPMAYWRLDEASGTTAYDRVGGNNGRYFFVALGLAGYNPLDPDTAGGFGSLASANSYVGNIPIDFATAGNAAFSVEAWVNGLAQNGDKGIVSKGTGGGGEQFDLDTGSDGGSPTHAFRFFVRDAAGNPHHANGTIAPNGRWHHLVGVCDEAHGFLNLYVDGVTNASSAVSGGILGSTNTVAIGARQSGTGAIHDLQFVGTIDEVAIYNYALSPAQALAHYTIGTNAPLAIAIGAPAGRWQLSWNWTNAILQSAPQVTGPFTDVPGAVMPYPLPPAGTNQFYRVRFPAP